MEELLVLYRAPTSEVENSDVFVVPARLPEYGDEGVLGEEHFGVGNRVVRTKCSFRQSYAPQGLIGRFLAFANANIVKALVCWQNGAQLIWADGPNRDHHDVLVYETHSSDTDSGSMAYPQLVLCVKGSTADIHGVLDGLRGAVETLFVDKVHGYPGLGYIDFDDSVTVLTDAFTGDLRQFIRTEFEMIRDVFDKATQAATGLLEAFYLAANEDNLYPRLLIVKPESLPRELTAPGCSPTARAAKIDEGNGVMAAEERQPETWEKWIELLKQKTKRRRFRLVFICEHDMTEVECGPGGLGYRFEELPELVKACLPLLKVRLV